MNETPGAPRKYKVSVQAMDGSCTEASGNHGDFTELGEMDANQFTALFEKFHRLPYPRPGLDEDHCLPQVLI